MTKPFSLLKKIIIIICVIALITTCITISTKYILTKRLDAIIESVKDDNVQIDASIANEIDKTLHLTGKVNTYQECFLSAIYAKYNGNYEEAVTYFENAVEYVDTDEEEADLYRKIGILYSEIGEYSKAIAYLNKALAKNDKDENSLLYMAECYLQQGDYAKAIDYIDDYRLHYSLTTSQYETVMTMYLAMSEYDEAINFINEAIENLPDKESDFILYRLQANIMKDDLDSARVDASQYLAISGNDIDPEVIVASYLYALEKYDKALEIYTSLIYDNDQADYYNEAIECAYQIDDYTTMLKLSNDAIKYYDDEEEIDFFKWKAIALMQEGEYNEALTYFNKYIDKNPEHYEVIYLRALCHFTLSNYEKAIEDFSSTISSETMLEDSLYNRALCYVQMNDIDNTLADLQAVVDLASGNDTYLSAVELLALLSEQEENSEES